MLSWAWCTARVYFYSNYRPVLTTPIFVFLVFLDHMLLPPLHTDWDSDQWQAFDRCCLPVWLAVQPSTGSAFSTTETTATTSSELLDLSLESLCSKFKLLLVSAPSLCLFFLFSFFCFYSSFLLISFFFLFLVVSYMVRLVKYTNFHSIKSANRPSPTHHPSITHPPPL